jgi:hypothetical protein
MLCEFIAGTCCGCFNFRQGSIFAVGLGMVIGLIIVFLFVYLSFDPMSITQYVVRDSKLIPCHLLNMLLRNSRKRIACYIHFQCTRSFSCDWCIDKYFFHEWNCHQSTCTYGIHCGYNVVCVWRYACSAIQCWLHELDT